jgi:chemotaxis protein CheX
MRAELINPFVNVTLEILRTMAQTEAKVGTPSLKKGNTSWGEVTGLIGMAGDTISGNMLISFDRPCILSIVSKMLMEPFEELGPDVVDAVGEITNMICGGVKRQLSEQGMSFSMASPIMLSGKDIEIAQLSKAPVLQIPFTTEAGGFVVEANLAANSGA